MTNLAQPPVTTPFTSEQTAAMVDQFNRDGYLHLPGLYAQSEVDALRERIDRAFADPSLVATHNRYGDIVMTRVFELDPMFVSIFTREPVASLLDAILGPDCHVVANNVIRNEPGRAIDFWHVDDFVWLPLPDEIPRHDPRMKFPNFMVTVHQALTDIEADEFGPMQIVPGSHYSGREPNSKTNPTFEGRGPVSVHVRAGDVYIQHPQAWHRGAPNTSNRTRYLLTHAWGQRFISHRFFPFLNYQVPEHILKNADARLLRVLGKHEKAAYG